MLQAHRALGLGVVESHSVLHPGLVVPVWEVLPRMRPPGLLALLGAVNGNSRVCQQVLQLKCLYTSESGSAWLQRQVCAIETPCTALQCASQ